LGILFRVALIMILKLLPLLLGSSNEFPLLLFGQFEECPRDFLSNEEVGDRIAGTVRSWGA
jgi:hypothetical protein